MAITKEAVIEKIEIVGTWNVQVATDTVIKEDGIFLNQKIDEYANEVLLPEMRKVFPNSKITK